jgi:hypothetical protein
MSTASSIDWGAICRMPHDGRCTTLPVELSPGSPPGMSGRSDGCHHRTWPGRS